MARRAKKDIAAIGLRIREPLRAKIERAAKQRGVSMNAEIVGRLERSFERQDLLAEVLTLAFGDEVAEMLIELRKDGALALGHRDRETVRAALNAYFDRHLPAPKETGQPE